MKVLLCSPNSYKPVYNQAGLLPSLTGICPPLGVGYLASSIKEDGHDVHVYDWAKRGDTEIKEAIRCERPDIIGVSCFTLTRGAALDVARLAKKVDPSIHVVFGGSHATAMAGQMLEHYPEIDAVIQGEGEFVLREWLRSIETGDPATRVPSGVVTRRDGKIEKGEKAHHIPDLDILPFPSRKLSNNPSYKPFPEKYHDGKQASLIASRGCPYKCQFCSTSVFWGNRYRMRSVGNVIREVQQLVEEDGMEDIEILDDAFTVKKEWILEFCSEVRSVGLDFEWGATTSVNYVDAEVCSAMRHAGCRRLNLGVESFSDRILKGINKKITSTQAVKAIETVRKAGLSADCLLMVGNPGETWATINENIGVIRQLKLRSVTVNMTQVYPETELYEISKRGGLVDDSYWLDETKAAPIFTLENSVEQITEYIDAIMDAQWSNHFLVSLYRKSGLRRLCHLATGKKVR